MSIYKVVGHLGYRGHKPGEIFEAILDPGAEARGIRRRNIILIDECKPELQPGSYRLPEGWINSTKEGSTDG